MSTNKNTLTSVLITQSIAILVFIGVPILLTLMAPLSTLEFRTAESGPSVTVVRYVLVFIPWQTQQADNVQKLHADITAEKRYRGTSEERRKGQKGVRLATGQLEIFSQQSLKEHPDASQPDFIVQADPKLAKEIEKQFEEFVKARPEQPKRRTVYASWPLSYGMGGVATGFCALYVVCAAIAVVMYPFKLAWLGRPDRGIME